MSVSAFSDKVPQFAPGVFVHADARILGDVVPGTGVTVTDLAQGSRALPGPAD